MRGIDGIAPASSRAMCAIALLNCALLVTTSSKVSAQLRPGDILLNNFGGSNIQVYDGSGQLRQTITGTGGLWEGASLTADFEIVTTHRSPNDGINIFSPAGVEVATFDTPQVDIPGDVSVFADGTLAVSDQLGNEVELFSRAGAHLGTISAPGLRQPFGSAIDIDDTLWVAAAGFGVFQFERSGALVGQFNPGFRVSDLTVDFVDGTLWLTNRFSGEVANFTPDGVLLSEFQTSVVGELRAIAIDANRRVLVVGEQSTNVLRYGMDGLLLDSFPIDNPEQPLFMTVVPGPEPPSITPVGREVGNLARKTIR